MNRGICVLGICFILITCCSCTGAEIDSTISVSSASEGAVISENVQKIYDIDKITIDGVAYGPEITVGDFDVNDWVLDVSRDNSVALKKLLNKGSGAVALKCYNNKYTVRVNGNLDYENDSTFTIDVVYTLFSYTEQGIDGLITEISILPYNWHDRTFIDNYPSVEYEGIKLGDSYEVAKKVLGNYSSENESIFLERTWTYDDGTVTLMFDREKDFVTGIKYKITKR